MRPTTLEEIATDVVLDFLFLRWLLNNQCGKFIDAFWLKFRNLNIVPFADDLVCVAVRLTDREGFG